MESMAQITASANGWPSRASGILKRVLWAVTGRKRPENWPPGQGDRRVSHRLEVRFEAKISSRTGWMRVRGVNLHPEGALIIANRPLAPQSIVFVRLKSFGLMGFAQVRYCTERGPWSYAIGVSFPAPLMRERRSTRSARPIAALGRTRNPTRQSARFSNRGRIGRHLKPPGNSADCWTCPPNPSSLS